MARETNILDLSDYALLEILKYSNATDLWQLSRTCKRFRYLVAAKKLWTRIDLRDSPLDDEKVAFSLENVNEFTDDVRLCAKGRHAEVIAKDFLRHLNRGNLTVLALENQKLYGNRIKLVDFPKSLVELSLRKTFVTMARDFLDRGNEQMTNLKVFVLDQCFWVETIMLVQLSKYQSLEILSLYNCKRIDDGEIAYISLAGRFGFNSLRVLDCRFSGLGDQILRTFYNKPNLREVYFQNYLTTYFLEKGQRELEISLGASAVRGHSYVTELDDIPMFSERTIELFFGETELRKECDLDSASDNGTLVYRFAECARQTDGAADAFESVLYERPYPDCACSAGHAASPRRNKGPPGKMKSLKKREVARIEESVDSELAYAADGSATRNVHLLVLRNKEVWEFDPSIEGTVENRYVDWIFHREPRNDYEMATLEHTDLYRSSAERDKLFLLWRSHLRLQATSVQGPAERRDAPGRHQAEDAPSSSSSLQPPAGRPACKRKRPPDESRSKRREPAAAPQQQQQPNQEQYVLINAFGRPVKHKVRLARLSLRGYKRVTDRSLDCLAHLNLALLDVAYTSVTADGVGRFVALNPRCRVVHESRCRCRPRMHF